MEKRMGRPPVAKEDQLSEIIQFRMTPSERQRCEQAAEADGVKFSAWIRERLLRAPRRNPKAQ
jgi:hypothetical protein